MVDLQFHGKKGKACSQGKKPKKTRLTKLPEDILLHILSSLPMKEAGRTNVLSSSWRYLWSNIPNLNFYSPDLTDEISVAQKMLEAETPRYIRWVDQVVSSYNNIRTVDEFWVQCYLQADYVRNVDDWVRFAMEKKVKRFQMDVAVLSGGQLSHYTFPKFSSDSLNSLKLSGVNVTGEALETFLVTCSVLEFLCVESSDSLVELKVIGQSLRLKHLTICCCNKIKKFEISAPNLVLVTYHGPEISVPFKSNPELAKISLGGDYAIALTNTFMEHSSYLSQLEVLELILECMADRVMNSINNFPKLERLKELSVHINPWPYPQLLYMKPLIDKCPFLYKFTLILNNDAYVSERKLRKRWTVTPHGHLKIVQIDGLYGIAGAEFALWLLDTADSLEKIIINPHNLLKSRSPQVFDTCEEKRNMAKQLGEHLKPGTDLLIL